MDIRSLDSTVSDHTATKLGRSEGSQSEIKSEVDPEVEPREWIRVDNRVVVMQK